MAEHEPDREFAAWLAAVNDDINTALEEHLAAKPDAARTLPTADRRSSTKPAEAAAPTEEDQRLGPAGAYADRPTIIAVLPPVGSPAPGGAAPEDAGFLTVAQAAAVMQVSKMTVYRMVHSGELTAVRVGRSVRVPAKAVREYLSHGVESSRPGGNPH